MVLKVEGKRYSLSIKCERGPTGQWVRIFEHPIMTEMDYFFLLEPDNVAVRDYWLNTVYNQVNQV